MNTKHSGRYVAYYRVSTARQGRSGLGLEAQRQAVGEHLNGGNWKLIAEFTEVESGKRSDRPKLAEALKACRLQGAKLIIAKLDRLARSVRHLLEIVEAIDARNAHLRVLGMGLDTSTATGKLMLSILGSVGEFERNNMLERQREGIAAAKLAGKYNGKPADKAKHAAIRKLHAEGLGVSAIARQVGCAKSTACEVIKAT